VREENKICGYAGLTRLLYGQLEIDRSTSADEHLDARQPFAMLAPAQEMN
jgi:hypothetical protein